MNVLVLRNTLTPVADIIRQHGDNVVEHSELIDLEILKKNNIEFVVSHGYRHIIKPPIVNFMRNRIINLHISLLPWNRGADPNLWSFLENTPKGITIHYLDEGVDTGDIISQREFQFDIGKETLASTYRKLNNEMVELFQKTWPLIRGGGNLRKPQQNGGTNHRVSDKNYFKRLLVNGWDTPVSDILGKGSFYLRDVRVGDKETIRQWRNSTSVSKYMYTDNFITEEEHELWFQAIVKDPSCMNWIIVYNKEEVGLVNIYNIDQGNRRCCYASYIASQDLRGKGIGMLSEYYILKYLFEDLEFNKVCAEVFSFNKAGVNVHKSLGFQEEGLYRQHRMKNGQLLDVVALAMLKSEWDEKKIEIEKKLKIKGIL